MALRGASRVGKIICLGKNYLLHAKELGDAVPDKPVLFLKPPSMSVFVSKNNDVANVTLPKGRGSVHYETEILLQLGPTGKIDAVSLGLDLTLRELQADLKKKGHPWELGKVFPGAAIVGPWIKVEEFPNYLDEAFTLEIDETLRQKGKGSSMTMLPLPALEYIQEYWPLEDGDVVFTGTPEGVGPVEPGQLAVLTWGDRLKYSVQFS